MRPIEYRTDLAFMQALRCVEYRLPPVLRSRPKGYLHTLALRYGLIGAAASHHLLLSASDEDEPLLLQAIGSWPRAVQQHFQWETAKRIGADCATVAPDTFAQLAYQPVVASLSFYRRLCPLDRCLQEAAQEYLQDHEQDLREGWSWMAGKGAIKAFRKAADLSCHYAKGFFERRQFGLEEVQEIALLGE